MDLSFLSNLSQVIGTLWQIAVVPLLGWLIKLVLSNWRERVKYRKELEKKFEGLNDGFIKLQVEHNDLHNRCDHLEEVNKQQAEMNLKLTTENAAQQKKMNEMEAQLLAAERRLAEAERKHDRDEATIRELRSEVLKLGLALDRREEELKEAKRVIDELSHKVGTIEKKGTGELAK